MKLKEYMDNLSGLIRRDSRVLDMEVYYASDDECNEFIKVFYKPTVQCVDDETTDVVCIN